jgi:hypothetical protein
MIKFLISIKFNVFQECLTMLSHVLIDVGVMRLSSVVVVSNTNDIVVLRPKRSSVTRYLYNQKVVPSRKSEPLARSYVRSVATLLEISVL